MPRNLLVAALAGRNEVDGVRRLWVAAQPVGAPADMRSVGESERSERAVAEVRRIRPFRLGCVDVVLVNTVLLRNILISFRTRSRKRVLIDLWPVSTAASASVNAPPHDPIYLTCEPAMSKVQLTDPGWP